ncbi:hypothetical protein [Methylobacterium brachythecii]|uniref:Uncharacterized protein n=1 Tax=Methylobacterium brachythecii TaxID=1176177 RepID=A0A7W6AKV3_9HYPH|nr:hypothetical protein [Methylobacterium brachythecii]MBB3905322.1 hypothetical protein [Methylobacterium brachythecii]
MRAQAYGQAVRRERAAAGEWEQRAVDLAHELAVARAEAAAHDAGRLAQIRALRTALEAVAPMDPVLRRTGRLYADGEREQVWQAFYVDAYDAIARANGLSRCRGAMTPQERADAAEAAVLAEPVRMTWWLWHRRWWWRNVEHRTEAGAIRARSAAARAAREATAR